MGMTDKPIKPDPDKKPKRPRDANQLAKNIVDLATGHSGSQRSGGHRDRCKQARPLSEGQFKPK
ncbi:MAG: hypothetical protein Kow00105_17190 [Phycisphaeraceae bacterium]